MGHQAIRWNGETRSELCLAEAICDVRTAEEAIEEIMARAKRGPGTLGVASINLEHLRHIHAGALMPTPAEGVDWLSLIDGAPLARRASQVLGERVVRVAGSDLAIPLLAQAAEHGLRFGIVGGTKESQTRAAEALRRLIPNLRLAGMWSPDKKSVEDERAATLLADEISSVGVDLLMVCLGKPKQERWIAQWGARTGAKVCLAFGGVVDLLAGKIPRAPRWMTELGLEWAWRLVHEPRRLGRRYLIDGPADLRRLQRHAHVVAETFAESGTSGRRSFVDNVSSADVSALIVTLNSAGHIGNLINDLRTQAGDLSLRVMICDNGSTDATLEEIRTHSDVLLFEPGENLGYAGGINLLRSVCGPTNQYLVLNPDLTPDPDMLMRLRMRMAESGAGIVVPQLLATCGMVRKSLRREPTVTRAWGDALLGQYLPRRPSSLSEEVPFGVAYSTAHPIDWATGAAMLIRADLHDKVGDWDERFFLYSEETDFMRRIRETGSQVWYEPAAKAQHSEGGSGSSAALRALLLVNKARYFRKWNSPASVRFHLAALITGSLLRSRDQAHRLVLQILTGRQPLSVLPGLAENRRGHASA